MAERALRGNLDHKSRDMAGEVSHKDRKSICQLNSLLNKVCQGDRVLDTD